MARVTRIHRRRVYRYRVSRAQARRAWAALVARWGR